MQDKPKKEIRKEKELIEYNTFSMLFLKKCKCITVR